jgi:drug/metabolite transporter (DMT)-like permease
MTKFIVILLLGLFFEAVGVTLLSHGLKSIGGLERVSVPEVMRLVGKGASQPSILLGVFFEAVFFGFLLYLLAQRDVSLVWPLTALGFVLTALVAHFYLGEQVSGLRWAGVCLIVIGAMLVTWSEKRKERVPSPAPSAPSFNPK